MATSKKYLPDTIRKKIIVMAAGGSTTAEIMQATGQTAPTISKVCKDVDIIITRKQEKTTEEKCNAVLDLHSKGYTPTEITCETGIPVSSVRTIIRNAKIITFPNAEKHPEEEVEQQLQIPICNEIKEVPIEALRRLRDAIDMIIEAMTS